MHSFHLIRRAYEKDDFVRPDDRLASWPWRAHGIRPGARPEGTINGLIDNVTSYSQNISNNNGGLFNATDSMWYGRTRGRFDIIGEIGRPQGVLGLELDEA